MHILASWSARMPIPSCQEAKMPAFLVSWCQDTWLPGTWYLAVWSNTVRARGHLAHLVPFATSDSGAKTNRKSSKIVIFGFHAATQPKCHESILFATFAPCWHGTKNIKKSTFWHPKIDILRLSVHILASWTAAMPIPSCQETKMPAF